jgi:hypothetical protein
MPDFYQAFLTASYDEVFRTVEDSIIDGAVALDVLVCRVAVHRFEVDEAAEGLIALIFSLEGVLKDFGGIELIKVGALNGPFGVFIAYDFLKTILLGG